MVDNIYDGFWVNWEDGRFKGATLTLPTYQGLVLISFLTLYVQFSGGCFWRVLCFTLHQLRSTATTQDGLFHQQQVILRNSITAPNAMWKFSRSALAWRGKVNSPFLKSLTLMIITAIHISCFAAAGLFSSRVTDTSKGQALVKSGTCGFPIELSNVRNTESQNLTREDLLVFNTEVLLGRLTLSKSMSYVRTCYNDDINSATAICNSYIQPHLVGINASAAVNASCPFGNDACATPAARYDSGVILSNEHLGINLPSSESLSMRRVTTCAPILAENKYSTGWRPETSTGRNTSAKYYEFGKAKLRDNGCESLSQNATTPNTTFCVTQYQKENTQAAYTVRAQTVYHGNDSASDFTPIPEFDVPNADVTLISIFSQARYAGNSSDPLFLAQKASTVSSQFYTSTNDLNILGCTEQYQLCNLRTSACTSLTGLYGVKSEIDDGKLDLNIQQTAVYNVLWKSAWAMSLQWAAEVLSDNLLLARDWVFTAKSTTSSALPDNQWELESYNLHNLSLAVFQRRVNEYASPENFDIRPGVNSLTQIVPPTDPHMLALCGLQKIRSGDHYSVSVLGMCIILIVGGFLILMDWVLVQQIFWFRSVTHHRLAKKADWTNTGTLQLQKQALEARGVGPWTTNNYEFPVLLESGKEFMGLGAQADRDVHMGYTYPGATAYYGGNYMAVPHQRSGSDVKASVLADDKGSHGEIK